MVADAFGVSFEDIPPGATAFCLLVAQVLFQSLFCCDDLLPELYYCTPGHVCHPFRLYGGSANPRFDGAELPRLNYGDNVFATVLRGPKNTCLMTWWTGRESNPRPPECHSGALPTELPAHLAGWPAGPSDPLPTTRIISSALLQVK
jgi:hypothetical protein